MKRDRPPRRVSSIRRLLGLSTAPLFLLLAISPVHAEFSVRKVEVETDRDRLLISADMDLGLTAQVEAAVNNGVPIVLLTRIALVRNGVLWNDEIDHVTTRARLRYHALSDHYVVDVSDSEGIEMFRSVDDALRRIGTVRDISLTIPGAVATPDYSLAVRSRLDIEALPGPLRPMAFLSSDWRLDSKWTHWRLGP